jgi:hypothetical protein
MSLLPFISRKWSCIVVVAQPANYAAFSSSLTTAARNCAV